MRLRARRSALSLGGMSASRTRSTKLVFISYLSEREWEAFELRFNMGQSGVKRLKFQASRTWRTSGSPAPFSGFRASFANQREAEAAFAEQIVAAGGQLHAETASLKSRLKSHHDYLAA
jgi:hypothetical protein